MHTKYFYILILVLLFSSPVFTEAQQIDPYTGYLNQLEKTITEDDISKNGFTIIEGHEFEGELDNLGPIRFIPAIDEKYGRIVLFFADPVGRIVYKTDQLASNNWNRGQMNQPNTGLAAVDFKDMNNDGKTDICIICICSNETGSYANKPYKVGDVLFQNAGGFYKDLRLTDRINRFGMNKNVAVITAFVRDGKSAEFLYTSQTREELLHNGFTPIEYQCFTVDFEKYGNVYVIPGTYNIAGHHIFMIYLTTPQGQILRNFQSMGNYDNFYELRGLSFEDADGDGFMDITVLARYCVLDEKNNTLLENDFSIYYQRTGYFYEDDAFKNTFPATGTYTLGAIIQNAREFWRKEAEK